ncbi:MAG: SIS domain-containing protein [Kiritimatiellae bacterium]|nr:SIS domain-containing protein [Kiritimatiellia bacterium]
MTNVTNNIPSIIEDSAKTVSSMLESVDKITDACNLLINTLKTGGTVFTAGNGGSAAEAMHMAEEIVGRFRNNRISLPSVSLVADSTVLTCIGNDFGFDKIFSRQIDGLGRDGDLLVIFSTSGNAQNLMLAMESARVRKMKTLCILGRDGGPLAGVADCEVIINHNATERIQEAHQVILHILLDAVENAFWPSEQ